MGQLDPMCKREDGRRKQQGLEESQRLKKIIIKWNAKAPSEDVPSGTTDKDEWKCEQISKALYLAQKPTQKNPEWKEENWTATWEPGFLCWSAFVHLELFNDPKFCLEEESQNPTDRDANTTCRLLGKPA